MATNIPSLEAMKHMTKLIDELTAWNRFLKHHISAQKTQGGLYKNDSYEYDNKSKKILRLRSGKVVKKY